MNDEEQWRREIVKAHPYAGDGLELDEIIARGRHRARRKRAVRRGASIVGVVALLAGGGLLVHRSTITARPSSVRTAGHGPGQATLPGHTSSTPPPSVGKSPTTLPDTMAPTTSEAPPSSPAPPPTTAPVPVQPAELPIAVQSDAETKANGNGLDSSSILAPTSCSVTGGHVTARGGYTNGGFAPNIFNRWGAVVKLYVYTAPTTQDPDGKQVVDLGAESAAPIGGYGPWEVTAPFVVGSGVATRCVVGAQATHGLVLAGP